MPDIGSDEAENLGAGIRRVAHEGELALVSPLAIGTPILVERTRRIHYSVGLPAPAISARLGWVATNIWLPDHARQNILRDHPVFPDLFAAIRILLEQPDSVRRNPTEPASLSFVFVAGAEMLRQSGLLSGQRSRYVDAIVEWRHVRGRRYLRLFHLSPRRRAPGGAQLWP